MLPSRGLCDAMTSKNASTPGRPQRSYSTRSSTVSVTQLLSDSCSSFLNRIANRVRGPSVNLESASRNRRSKGPNMVVRDKQPIPLSTSASFVVKPEPRSGLSSSDLSKQCHVERKHDHQYWTRSREDVRDGKRWLTVPESVKSREHAAKRDYPEWKYKSFATGEHYGKSNRSLYGAGDVAAASVSDMRSGRNANSYYLGATRSRLEDKYYDVLAKSSYTKQQRPLAKSATSVVLSEKAYPYVSTAATAITTRRGKTRDTTPYREEKTRSEHRHKSSSRRETVLYTFKPLRCEGREGTASSRHRLNTSSSCKDLSRLRAGSPHVSAQKTKSEKRSIEKTAPIKPRVPLVTVDVDKTVSEASAENGKTLESERVSSSASDRDIKRKEIQALIEKYAGLDEQTSQELPSVLVKCQKKYSAVLSPATAECAAKAVSVRCVYMCSCCDFNL